MFRCELIKLLSSNLLCVTIYRYPNSDVKKLCLLAGDFNVDLFNYEKNAFTADFLNTLNSYFFMHAT